MQIDSAYQLQLNRAAGLPTHVCVREEQYPAWTGAERLRSRLSMMRVLGKTSPLQLRGILALLAGMVTASVASAQATGVFYFYGGGTTALWGDSSNWYAYNPSPGGVAPAYTPASGTDVYIANVGVSFGSGPMAEGAPIVVKTVGNLEAVNSQLNSNGEWGKHTGTLVATGSDSVIRGLSIGGGLELRNEGTMRFDRDGNGNGNLGSGDLFRFRNASTGTLNIGTLVNETRTISMGYYSGYFINEGITNIDTVAGATVQFANSYAYWGGSQTNSGTLNKTGVGLLKFDAYYQTESGVTNVTGGTFQALAADLAGQVNVSAGATFDIAGGGGYFRTGLDVNGPGTFLLSGGSQIAEGASTFDNLTMTGGAIYNEAAAATMTVGNLHLSGGALGANYNKAAIYATGNSTISGNILLHGNYDTQAPVVVNQGTMTWTAGVINATNRMYLENAATGTFIANVGAGGTLEMHGGWYGGYFRNLGTVRKTGAGNADIYATYLDSGTTDVQAGVLQFRGYGDASGTLNIESGAIARLLGSTFTLKNGFKTTGSGVFEASSGSLVMEGNASIGTLRVNGAQVAYNEAAYAKLTVGNLHLVSGSLGSGANKAEMVATGSGSTITGTLTLHGNGDATPTLTNSGTMTWSGGNLYGGGILKLKNTGTFIADVAVDTSREIASGWYGGVFTNEGTLRKTGAGVAQLNTYVANSGGIAVEAGRLEFGQGGGVSGTLAISTGAVTRLSGGSLTLNNGFSATGAGVFEATGGSLLLEGNSAIATLRVAGTQAGYNETAYAKLTVGDLHLVSGSLGSGGNKAEIVATGTGSTITGTLTLHSGGATNTLTNSGTMTWSGGNLNGGSVFLLKNTGTFIAEVAADASREMVSGYYGGAFTNEGTLRKTGAGVAQINTYLVNSGGIAVEAGRLDFGRGGAASGTLAISSGASRA